MPKLVEILYCSYDPVQWMNRTLFVDDQQAFFALKLQNPVPEPNLGSWFGIPNLTPNLTRTNTTQSLLRNSFEVLAPRNLGLASLHHRRAPLSKRPFGVCLGGCLQPSDLSGIRLLHQIPSQLLYSVFVFRRNSKP